MKKTIAILLLLLLVVSSGVSAQVCRSGEIGGLVYFDYNSNGIIDAGDEGSPNVNVTAYDSENNIIDSAITGTSLNNLGQYKLNIPAGTSARLEISGYPSYVKAGACGPDSLSKVSLITANDTCDYNFGLSYPNLYCSEADKTEISIAVYANLDDGADSTMPVVRTVKEAELTDTYPGSVNDFSRFPEATQGQVGSIWGMAYSRVHDTIYMGSYIKSGSSVLTGAGRNQTSIYKTTPNSGAPSLWYTVDPSRANPVAPNGGGNGIPSCREDAHRDGLGDVDISLDGKTLYTVDLKTKELVSIAIDSNGNPSTVTKRNIIAQAVAASPMIQTECSDNAGVFAPQDLYPFGLGVREGKIYVTLTCVASSSLDQTKLRAYVFEDTLNSNGTPTGNFIEKVSMPLDFNPTFEFRWTPSQILGDPYWGPHSIPCAADVENDKGDLVVSFIDLSSNYLYQTILDGDCGARIFPGKGDIVRVCRQSTSPETWEQETLYGGADPNCSTAGIGNIGLAVAGPIRANEYYWEDHFAFNSATQSTSHPETSLGGILQIPGRPYVANASIVPFNPDSFVSARAAGISFLDNRLGSWTGAVEVYDEEEGVNLHPNFRKGQGLGDLVALCPEAPIQIGNLVFMDVDGDGVQDANEMPVAGVTVSLCDAAGNEIGNTLTDSDGVYKFGGFDDTGLNSGSIQPNTTYTIKLDNPSDFLRGGPLAGKTITLANIGLGNGAQADATDSDPTNPDSITVTLTTGEPGDNDHTYDFGFVPKPSVEIGDLIWIDLNGDGIQDPDELGVPGVTVTLYDKDTGLPITSTVTDSNGNYIFNQLDGLEPNGSYQVCLDNSVDFGTGGALEFYTPVVSNQGADDAKDSDIMDSNGISCIMFISPSEGGSNYTYDFGFEKTICDPNSEPGGIGSCCEVSDQTEDLRIVDNNAKVQAKLTRRALRVLKKFDKSSATLQWIKDQIEIANKNGDENWARVWGEGNFARTVVTCEEGLTLVNCSVSDSSAEVSAYIDLANVMVKQLKKVRRRANKASNGEPKAKRKLNKLFKKMKKVRDESVELFTTRISPFLHSCSGDQFNPL